MKQFWLYKGLTPPPPSKLIGFYPFCLTLWTILLLFLIFLSFSLCLGILGGTSPTKKSNIGVPSLPPCMCSESLGNEQKQTLLFAAWCRVLSWLCWYFVGSYHLSVFAPYEFITALLILVGLGTSMRCTWGINWFGTHEVWDSPHLENHNKQVGLLLFDMCDVGLTVIRV